MDAGPGVDLDSLLDSADRLVAIFLTHAHRDHYAELTDASRHGAPILTSPATAQILDDTLDTAAEHDAESFEDVTDAIEPISDWTSVVSGVEVHPIPAGHAPGAIGLLFRVTDGDQTHHLVATGDFTCRRVGGFAGFAPDGFVDVDALFLTAATNNDFTSSLTEALGIGLSKAHSGSRTLVTTSGLVGPQIAYLLSAIGAEYDRRVPIRIVGQAAKIYDALEYDCPDVESVPRFSHTSDCLAPGVLTIAGPETPEERSSGRLFGVLREDPNAVVVQLIGSDKSPRTDGQCTIHSYSLSNHPTRETLVAVHDAIQPTETIITHEHDGAEGAFNDLSSVVWGAGSTDEYTLYDGSQWCLPHWMDGDTVTRSHDQNMQQFAGTDLLSTFSVPQLKRHTLPDLEAEGIDEEQLADLLHRGRQTETDSADRDTVYPSPTHTATKATTPSMTTNDSDTSTDNAQTTTDTEMVRTTGPDVSDELDPQLQAAIEDGSLSKEDIAGAVAARNEAVKRARAEAQRAKSEASADDTEAKDRSKGETASGADSTSTTPTDDETRSEAETEPASDADLTTNDIAPDSESSDTSISNEAPTNEEDQGTEQETEVPAGEPTTQTDRSRVTPAPTRTLHLNPAAIALAVRDLPTKPETATVEDVVADAISKYTTALLADDASCDESERFRIEFEGSQAAEQALTTTSQYDFESPADLIAEGIAAAFTGDTETDTEVAIPERQFRYLNAVIENDAYVFDNYESAVEAAITWHVTTRAED